MVGAIRCRVLFPGSTGGLCSINKSIFSPIQGYLVSNRFTILRSPPARPIFDSDIMSRLREINDLNFPLIETLREKLCARFLRAALARFSETKIDFVFTNANEFISRLSRSRFEFIFPFTEIKQRDTRRAFLGERLFRSEIAVVSFS